MHDMYTRRYVWNHKFYIQEFTLLNFAQRYIQYEYFVNHYALLKYFAHEIFAKKIVRALSLNHVTAQLTRVKVQ